MTTLPSLFLATYARAFSQQQHFYLPYEKKPALHGTTTVTPFPAHAAKTAGSMRRAMATATSSLASAAFFADLSSDDGTNLTAAPPGAPPSSWYRRRNSSPRRRQRSREKTSPSPWRVSSIPPSLPHGLEKASPSSCREARASSHKVNKNAVVGKMLGHM